MSLLTIAPFQSLAREKETSVKHPLIVQGTVAHNEGLGANWATRGAFWADRPAHEEALRKNLLSLATTKRRHFGNDPNVDRYDPVL